MILLVEEVVLKSEDQHDRLAVQEGVTPQHRQQNARRVATLRTNRNSKRIQHCNISDAKLVDIIRECHIPKILSSTLENIVRNLE